VFIKGDNAMNFLSKLFRRRVGDEDFLHALREDRLIVLETISKVQMDAVNDALREAGYLYYYNYKLVCDGVDWDKFKLVVYKVQMVSEHELVFGGEMFDQIRDAIRELPK